MSSPKSSPSPAPQPTHCQKAKCSNAALRGSDYCEAHRLVCCDGDCAALATFPDSHKCGRHYSGTRTPPYKALRRLNEGEEDTENDPFLRKLELKYPKDWEWYKRFNREWNKAEFKKSRSNCSINKQRLQKITRRAVYRRQVDAMAASNGPLKRDVADSSTLDKLVQAFDDKWHSGAPDEE